MIYTRSYLLAISKLVYLILVNEEVIYLNQAFFIDSIAYNLYYKKFKATKF